MFPRWDRRLLALGLAVAGGTIGVWAAWAVAAPIRPATNQFTTLPSSATMDSGEQSTYLSGISCTSQGSCVAAGGYATALGAPAMVATETGGMWRQAQELALPANADIGQDAAANSVSCPTESNCVVGGSYTDPNVGGRAMVADETNGVWGHAQQLPLPTNAIITPDFQPASVNSVSCTSQGNCVAGGSYFDTSLFPRAMVAAETNGVWGQAQELAVPSNSGGSLARVFGVSCPSRGNCVAGGAGLTEDPEDSYGPMVAAETNGVWGQAQELALPANGEAVLVRQSARVSSVSCISPGNCLAAGSYLDTSNAGHDMVASETNGVWGQAQELALSDASGHLASVSSVSCTSQGNCTAVGSYQDTSGIAQAMVAAETNGVWGRAQGLALPANASGHLASVASLSCTGQGDCGAVGSYQDTSGIAQAMVAAETNGVWGQAQELAPLVNAQSTIMTTIGDQQITLTTPSALACVARPARLTVKFASTRIRRSMRATLSFSSASFFIDQGLQQKVQKRVHGKPRLVTVYVPNATALHVPVTLHLSLSGLNLHTHTLKLVIHYNRTANRHGHKITTTITKTLSVNFRVC